MEKKCKCCDCKNICPTCGGTVPKDKTDTQENKNNSSKMNLNDVCKTDTKNFNLND